MQSKAKSVWLASTRKQAHKDSGAFVTTCGANFPKPVGCLENDQQKLLTFYNVTVEHWVYIRTTKPRELTFSVCAD